MNNKISPIIVIVFLNILAINVMGTEIWKPPLNPDVQKIIKQAQLDTAAGRYEVALQKYQWFHEKGKYILFETKNTWLNTVYSYWYDLGNYYPIALVELKAARDITEQKIKKDNMIFWHYYEYTSINEVIGQYDKSVSLFKWLDENNSKMADAIYSRAETELIFAEEYLLCNKYLDPKKRMEELLFILNNKFFSNRHEESKNNIINSFKNRVAVMIVLLSINGRDDEAKHVKSEALNVVDDSEFRIMLDEAFKHKFPDNFEIYNP